MDRRSRKYNQDVLNVPTETDDATHLQRSLPFVFRGQLPTDSVARSAFVSHLNHLVNSTERRKEIWGAGAVIRYKKVHHYPTHWDSITDEIRVVQLVHKTKRSDRRERINGLVAHSRTSSQRTKETESP